MATPTKKQKDESEKQKNQKIQLELIFSISLIKFLNKMSRKIKSQYLENQQILNLQVFLNSLASVLNINYLKIQKIFSKDQINTLQEQLKIIVSMSDKSNLFKILGNLSSIRAINQAAILLKTMQNQLNSSFFAEQTSGNSIEKIANDAIRVWKKETVTRINSTINNTEVQLMSETTKDVTSNYIIPRYSADALIVKAQKIWITVGDDRVRMVHAEANGQIVDSGNKFIVGGEFLKYPGDPSGSPWNIINCRCSSLTMIKI